MRNLRNSVKLIGHVGKDPEIKTFDSGKKMATFSIATTDTYKNQKGEKVQDTQWHTIVIWGKLADIAVQFVRKGIEIAVEGKLVHRSYEPEPGSKRYITEINVNEIMLLGAKR